jgi:hypothetical protein
VGFSFGFSLIPSWAIFLLTVAVSFGAYEIGFRCGKYRGGRSEQSRTAPISSTIGATLGLLAFILAFTFGLAAARFQERRELVLNDANAIETTYRRAQYLPGPSRTEIQQLLQEYVRIRIPIPDPVAFQLLLQRSEELQEQLWAKAVLVAEQNPTSVMAGLFISSLNEVLDIHSQRIMVGVRTRIPEIIWLSLYFITILSMAAMGFHSGLAGVRSLFIHTVMILTFSGVIFLIGDLDFSQGGFLKVSQQPILDVLEKIERIGASK